MNNLYLNISKSRKEFKNSLGQANHFLITALIGLDYISENEVSCPVDFSTSWNPKNKSNSIIRTRQYILKSSLAWAVDCLDSYLTKCNQNPKLIDDNDIIKEFDRAGRSVNEKFIVLANNVKPRAELLIDYNIYKSITALAIQWRNNTVHLNAQNVLDEEYRKILLMSSDRIKELFCGLNINDTLNSFDQKHNPTFKEVTSLIRGVQKVVEFIDLYLLCKIDIYRYANEIVSDYFKKNKNNYTTFMALLPERQLYRIVNILINNSFSDKRTYETSPKIEINNLKIFLI